MIQLKNIWRLFQKEKFNLVIYDNPEHKTTIILNDSKKDITHEKELFKEHEVLKITMNHEYKCLEIHIAKR